MPDSTRPTTGPLIMQAVVQLAEDVKAIRATLDTHAGAAMRRQEALTGQLNIIQKNGSYYGEELVKAYHRLHDLAQRLERKLEQLERTEQEHVV